METSNQLKPQPISRLTHRLRLLHVCFREWRVDDKVAVIGHDGTGLHLAHAQMRIYGAHFAQSIEDGGVSKGYDLDRHALLPLTITNG